MISLVLLLTVSVKLSISYCFTRSSRVISSNFHTVEKGIWTSEPWLQRESHWGSCGRTTTYNKSRWKCCSENTGKKTTTVANKKCTDRRKLGQDKETENLQENLVPDEETENFHENFIPAVETENLE